jgi:hypothetical protein
LKIRCPNAECRKVLVVDDSLAGQKGKCSTCGSKFVIPAPTAPPKASGERPNAAPPAPPGKTSSVGSSAVRKPAAPSAGSGEHRPPKPGTAPSAGAAAGHSRRPAEEELISADELSDFLIEDDGSEDSETATADFEDYEDYEAPSAPARKSRRDDFDDFDAPAPRRKGPAKPRDDFDDFEDYDAGDESSDAEDYDDYDDEPPRSRRSGGRSRAKPARKRSGSGGSLAKAGVGVLLLLINAYATLIFMIMVGVVVVTVLMGLAAPDVMRPVVVVVGIVTLVSGLAVIVGQFCQLVGYAFTVQAPDRGRTRTLSIILLVGSSIRILLFLGIFGTNWAAFSGLDASDLRNLMFVLQAFEVLVLVGMLLVVVSAAAEVILCPALLGSLNEQVDRRGTVADAETVRTIGIFLVAGMFAPILLTLFARLVPALAGAFAILFFVIQIAMLVLWFVYLIKLIALMKDTRYNIT